MALEHYDLVNFVFLKRIAYEKQAYSYADPLRIWRNAYCFVDRILKGRDGHMIMT